MVGVGDGFTVTVVGTTPLAGVDVPADQVPAPVQTATDRDIDRSGAPLGGSSRIDSACPTSNIVSRIRCAAVGAGAKARGGPSTITTAVATQATPAAARRQRRARTAALIAA